MGVSSAENTLVYIWLCWLSRVLGVSAVENDVADITIAIGTAILRNQSQQRHMNDLQSQCVTITVSGLMHLGRIT